jgi:undecaprenyl-diphosphatase
MSSQGKVDEARRTMAHRAGHLRAWQFQLAVLVATIVFGLLALLASTVWYFPVDLELTRALQGAAPAWVDGLLEAVSWIGNPPQSNVIFGAVIVGLFLVGLRIEALATLFAAVGSAGLWFLLAPLVNRPRPAPDLVQVDLQIPAGSFPSGHAVNLTAIFGFLIYLTLALVPDHRWRWLLVTLLALPILTIGVARVHAGAHWPSDVLGGYMLGAIWLALTIHLYHWAEQRFSARHADRRKVPLSD